MLWCASYRRMTSSSCETRNLLDLGMLQLFPAWDRLTNKQTHDGTFVWILVLLSNLFGSKSWLVVSSFQDVKIMSGFRKGISLSDHGNYYSLFPFHVLQTDPSRSNTFNVCPWYLGGHEWRWIARTLSSKYSAWIFSLATNWNTVHFLWVPW